MRGLHRALLGALGRNGAYTGPSWGVGGGGMRPTRGLSGPLVGVLGWTGEGLRPYWEDWEGVRPLWGLTGRDWEEENGLGEKLCFSGAHVRDSGGLLVLLGWKWGNSGGHWGLWRGLGGTGGAMGG